MLNIRRYLHRRERRKLDDRGFSLAEEILGIFLIAMLATIVVAVYPMAGASSKINGNQAQAISLAQHKIDQLRAVGFGRFGYSDLLAAEIIDATPNTAPFKFNTIDALGTYLNGASGTITFTTISTTLTQADVTITWNASGRKQTAGTYTLTAIIAKE